MQTQKTNLNMKLSHYEWDPEQDLIAEGGFAEVFKARDLHANRWVALKIYKEAVSRGTGGSTGQKKYSLEQEFARIDGLSHTNIISYYGLEYLRHQDHMGRTSNYPILIMEYAGEGSLSELIKKSISPKDTLRIVRGIVQAIAYLHDQGVIHRDLKPGNILFNKDRNGRLVPKVTDFGISKNILGEKTIEQSFTEGVGTPHYMAPEQFFKKKFGLNEAVSERTDLWAIGVILYRMLTGELPFGHGKKDYELIRDEIVGKEPDLTPIPENYRGLIKACLQKKATDRAATAKDLLLLLEPERTMTMAHASGDQEEVGNTQVLPSGTGDSPEKPDPDRVSAPPSRPRKLVWTVGLSAVLFLAAGIGGFTWYRNSKIQKLLSTAEDHYNLGAFGDAYESFVKASEYGSGRALYYLSLMSASGTGTDKDYEKSLQYADLAIDKDYYLGAFQKAQHYEKGWGVPIDPDKAKENYQQAFEQIEELANEDDPEAQKLLGLYYYYGYIGDKDANKSFDITKESAEKGHLSAMSNLAYLYYKGEGVEQDCQEAYKWYTKAAEANSSLGYQGLAILHYNGCDSIANDYKKAREHYITAANLGNLEATHMLGYIYQYGKGVPIDQDEALIWYRKSAAEGYISSMNSAGLIYESKENYRNAKYWLLKAAIKNDTYGAYNMGRIYSNASFGTLKYDSATYWYRKAALKGHSTASVNLGLLIYEGKGAPQNYDSAFYWFKQSALEGNNLGQYNTGVCYEIGHGTAVKPDSARYWYHRSAVSGSSLGQYKLGALFEDGIMVSRNYDSAFYWYQQAANQGSANGKYGLAGLYFSGKGVNKDEQKALNLYLEALGIGLKDNKYTLAQYRVGYIYHGQGSSKYNLAKTYYREAATLGNTSAQIELAKISEYQGYKNDAFYWFQQAANSNNSEAQRRLGLCHYKGIGTPKNKTNARYWLNLSCQNNNQKACTDLNTLL